MKSRVETTIAAACAALIAGLLCLAVASPTFGSVAAQIAPAQFAQAGYAGMYQGDVARHRVNGGQEETRTYRLAINPDMQNGAVWIYSHDRLLDILLITGTLSGNTFTGKTRPVQQTGSYTPDNIRLNFDPDGRSVRWQHNDGTILGSGILTRI